MMKEDPSLLTKRGGVTDEAGRTFEAISGLEYAYWARAKHTWTCMLDCISIDTKDRLDLLKQALVQYDKVNTKGITYTLNKTQVTGETYFDMDNTIINELQTQVDSIYAEEEEDWDEVDKQWKEGVGGVQKLFTAELVDAYCCDMPFDPVPDFSARPQSKKQFYNKKTKKYENWFGVDSKLGSDFAIYKGSSKFCIAEDKAYTTGRDLAALLELCKVRTEDFISLRTQLESLATVDKPSQVFQK